MFDEKQFKKKLIDCDLTLKEIATAIGISETTLDGYIFEDHVKKHTSCTWNSGVITKAATCTATGIKTYNCTLCSATKTSTVSALGHTFGSGSGWCSGCG